MARRIGVVIDPWELPYNGAVVSTRRFVFALEQAGYDFEIIAIGKAPPPAANGFRPLSIPPFNGIIDAMRAPLARPDRARLRAILDRCDLLHVQYPFLLAHAAIREAEALGVPVVCSFHVQPENILENLRLPSWALSRALYRLFIRFIYARADRVIAPSEFAADLLVGHGLTVPISVVSNGVPDRYFGVMRRGDKGTFTVLSVGRLAREKQQDTLIRAIALSRHSARIRLMLAGVGPRAGYLSRLARSLNVTADIGWVDDDALLREYGNADVFVHAGAIELEGMSVLEAMAAGNVVVVSDSADSACSRMIRCGHARFEKGNAADLAARLDHWLPNADARAAQGAANRLVAARHTHESAVAELMAIYDAFPARVSPAALADRANGTS